MATERIASVPLPSRRALALAAIALLALDVVLAWLALQATFLFVELVWRATAGRHAYGALLSTHLEQFRMLRWIQAGTALATAAAFLGWLARVHGALRAHGVAAATPGRAVGAFLVPGPNLVRPYRVLRALWDATDPRPAASRGAPWRLRWWWGLVLAAALAELAAGAAQLGGGGVLTLGAVQALALGACLDIAAAVLTITVVWTIDQRLAEAA